MLSRETIRGLNGLLVVQTGICSYSWNKNWFASHSQDRFHEHLLFLWQCGSRQGLITSTQRTVSCLLPSIIRTNTSLVGRLVSGMVSECKRLANSRIHRYNSIILSCLLKDPLSPPGRIPAINLGVHQVVRAGRWQRGKQSVRNFKG